MRYTRVLETGAYIWLNDDNLYFNNMEVPNNTVNKFLERLNDLRLEEFNNKINKGRNLIEQNKIVEVNDNENI